MLRTAIAHTTRIVRHTGLEPCAVAKIIGTALTVRRPRTRYLVGRDAIAAAIIARFVPDRLVGRLLMQMLVSDRRRNAASST